MITWICILVYLMIAYFAYKYEIKNWNHPTWEKIYFSFIWILALPLFVVHLIHNKL